MKGNLHYSHFNVGDPVVVSDTSMTLAVGRIERITEKSIFVDIPKGWGCYKTRKVQKDNTNVDLIKLTEKEMRSYERPGED